MIEKVYNYTITNDKIIEKIIEDDNVGINHIVLCQDEALPEHYSNSNIYMIVNKGEISLRLNDQEEHTYPAGSIIGIPFKTKMNVGNQGQKSVDFFIVKAPSPRMFNND
jgi:quercetin dioxygenase-like cupin family protein